MRSDTVFPLTYRYKAFIPMSSQEGIIVLHNTAEREYDPGHAGHYRIAKESIRQPDYTDIYQVEMTTFARKV